MVFVKQKNLQKSKLRIIKWQKEIYEKFDNLSKCELNTKSNKNFYVRNDVMINIIKHCRSEKEKEEWEQ